MLTSYTCSESYVVIVVIGWQHLEFLSRDLVVVV